ncbi:hypothetical protein [Azospirillum soli]|uniref:hypothetical protein n=1 Tax=Azospirillum soli TaxID=1304799 RepID=UPI001AE85829|nr:hypothetical protein [Azospirillum soli]MBP2315749.1 hypothetical protein [Azospirillum soli]
MGAKALKRMAVLLALALPGCAVHTVDCWQLGDTELADAQARGQCGDAFARNTQEIVPAGGVAPPQRRKPRPMTAERFDEEPAPVKQSTRKKPKPNL